jgi:hypothetical protein
VLCSLACALAGAAPGSASGAQLSAGPPTALRASFVPKRLGAATSVTVAIAIAPDASALPMPISQVEVGFPANIGLATTGLGVTVCEPAALQELGPPACPADSKMGSGEATVAVAFGSDTITEHVTLELYAAPSPDGYVHMAVLAEGREPIEARIVMAAVLHPGHLQIIVPTMPSVPGAEDVSVLSLRATLGGRLTYYERAHGRTVAYQPQGVSLPASCPRGGWHLSATLDFADGSSSRAGTVVGCPTVHG